MKTRTKAARKLRRQIEKMLPNIPLDRLSLGARRVLLALADRANDDGLIVVDDTTEVGTLADEP